MKKVIFFIHLLLFLLIGLGIYLFSTIDGAKNGNNGEEEIEEIIANGVEEGVENIQ